MSRTEIANVNAQLPPGTEVEIHDLESTRIEEGGGREPFAEPIKRTKVAEDGSIKIDGLKPGTYVVGGRVQIPSLASKENIDLQVAQTDEYRYVTFAVKEK
jgi:hypothetical protein